MPEIALLPWQQRVVAESKELDIKLGRLQTYLESDDARALAPHQRALLRQQYSYMGGYLRVLRVRIELFNPAAAVTLLDDPATFSNAPLPR